MSYHPQHSLLAIQAHRASNAALLHTPPQTLVTKKPPQPVTQIQTNPIQHRNNEKRENLVGGGLLKKSPGKQGAERLEVSGQCLVHA